MSRAAFVPLVRFFLCLWLPGALALAGEPPLKSVRPKREQRIVESAKQPGDFQYLAFPSLLRVGPDEVWIVYKAGKSHATDAGAALEIVRHTLSSGETSLMQRIVAPSPKLYQMGEIGRMADGSIMIYIDVQTTGWDGRHYRTGAEFFRWDTARKQFGPAISLGPVDGLVYGYPFEIFSEGGKTWQLIMSFGYQHQGARWGVDVIQSADDGRHWKLVRNLIEEFGGIHGNEFGFTRYADGFIVASRAYDRIARLHRTDAEFRVRHQTEITGKYSFVNSYIGRPRVFVRDNQGYLIGRNWTRPVGAAPERGATASEMQLCLLRFDPQTLAVTSCVIVDNQDNENVTDGYYAVTTMSGAGDNAVLHVFTYKALNRKAPDIIRLDFRWADVK